jgi:prolyl oligopeptidase
LARWTKKYPPKLMTMADTDSGEAPVLIRIETRAGHGFGKPTTKQIEEAADECAFLVKALRMKVAE